jgi:formylglycine-generating enzyme required for sulfatase activity
MEQRYLMPLAALLLTTALHANNISITNPTLTGTNTVNATTQVQFTISWANSWRTSSAPNNWDAAWVFVKYRHATTGEWHHAQLGSDAQHSAPAGSTVATGLLSPGTAYNAATNWGVGAFLYRSADGTGTFTANNVQLRWNYGQNSITNANIAEVKVFAVEMVYVPEGSFWVGDGGSNQGRFIAGGTDPGSPFQITAESAFDIANTAGALWGISISGNTTIGGVGTLPAAFPKGFAGFYLMKYEITQQQYVDFLNTLTRAQQNTRTGTGLAAGETSVSNRYVMSNNSALQLRNGIRCDGTINANAPITFYCDLNGNGTGGEADDGQWIACNYLSWADVAAYLDWGGLRPMSELEYEKACRGPVTPVALEFPWGNVSFRISSYTGTDLGTITEGVSDPSTGGTGNSLGNSAQFSNSFGPGRAGLFAGAGTDRVNAGASYYGAMELSGNVWERTVTVGNGFGRFFGGTLGDGAVDGTGNANAATWPDSSTALGAGSRGGGYNTGAARVVSSRLNAAATSNSRGSDSGGRGCRRVP